MSISTASRDTTSAPELSVFRLNLMRAGYAFMAVGLFVVKWPLLPDAKTLPLYEGVVVCMLTAMSLLWLVGLRYPVKLIPLLLFESAWKLIWLGLVALPKARSGDLDAATSTVMVNCLFVVVPLAVIPWSYVWRTYVTETGDRWR
jgi:hypothetical protein